MSFKRAFGFFFLLLAVILCYMNYTFYQKYNAALKSKKAMFEVESCESSFGNIKKTYALGKIVGQSSTRSVNITEYIKYMKRNNATNVLSLTETCKKGTVIPVWDYDIGILTGRDESKELQFDSIRSSSLFRGIKLGLLFTFLIFFLGVLLISKYK